MPVSSETTRIGYFGREGSNTQYAAIGMFGASSRLASYGSIQQIFRAVAEGELVHGVVPIENSVEGTVGLTNDMLYRSTLYITGEIYRKITHCLVGRPGKRLVDIRNVISHPQALGQCSDFLQGHGMQGVPFTDTASSVAALASDRYSGYGAIATREAASIYGMEILLENVGDFSDNYTRFVSISREMAKSTTGRNKVSVVVSVDNRPGSLQEVLEIYSKHGLNLSRIESRPVKHLPWSYIFFLDSMGMEGDDVALMELEEKCNEYRLLGKYNSSSPE